ncbi:MAG: MarR family transcriptional regulator [Anaerolineae bacterium]|jgi:DNA-binding MarR family transcriptional regulator|nr:MarR family transcriptional regulator [Anaerolineae bacterium]MBT4312161.1 MarR family transcriptional regulator [Anaerolineae bacterium]MBT4459334.1 MarR family transcriptional regulator [Anaerolineae bacterium]MBT4842782.1 MarR family transcriptional regulator [Anaerolineae bacterium]MBT6060038.1 MarR family transcriptional regulator [Anaerolineae bacterium]
MENNLRETAQRFLKLSSRLRRLGPGAPQPENLITSPSHMALIEFVATNPDCGIQEMAEAVKLSTPTVSISVRQLEKSGIIARKPHPKDGRAVQLFLTPEGEEIHQSARGFHRQKFEKLLSGLNSEERELLVSLLERALNAAETNN